MKIKQKLFCAAPMYSIVFSVILITGCANTADNYQPIVDGAKSATYNSDLTACQSLSRKEDYLNGDVKTSALIGATLGALTGAGGNGGDVLGGAVAGTLIGGSGEALKTRDDRKKIVIQCMRQRSHKVVG